MVTINTSVDVTLEPRRTTWGAIVQTATYTQTPVSFIAGTTLNEKYNVGDQEGIDPNSDIPHLGYFGIGRGSTYMKTLGDNSKETVNYLHEPVDAALYYQLPMVLRDLDDDITPAQRANYYLRALLNVGGVDKIAYYLKSLDRTTNPITAEKVIPATDSTPEQRTPLVSDPAYLNPTPYEPSSGNIRTDGAYVSVSKVLISELTEWDINEILNAKQVLTGNRQLEITEIGLFSAIPKTFTNDLGDGNVTYTEALRAQLNLVSPHRIMLNQYESTGLTVSHDIGVDDPTNFNFIF